MESSTGMAPIAAGAVTEQDRGAEASLVDVRSAPSALPAERQTSDGFARRLGWGPFLVAWDALVGALVVLLAGLLPVGLLSSGSSPAPDLLPLAAVAAVLAPLVGATLGLYDHTITTHLGTVQRLGRVLISGVVEVWGILVIGSAFGLHPDVAQLVLVSALMPCGRTGGRLIADSLRARSPERVLVVGSGRVAARVSELWRRHGSRSVTVVGFVDDTKLDAPQNGHKVQAGGVQFRGSIDQLPDLLDEGGVDRVLVAFSSRRDEDMVRVLQDCDAHCVDVDVVPRLFDVLGPEPRAYALGGLPVLSVGGRRHDLLSGGAKRTVDLVGSALLLIFLAPLMAVVALAILLDVGTPILYRQERVGRNGRRFKMVKFRTMEESIEGDEEHPIAAVGEGKLTIGEAVDALKQQLAAPSRSGGLLRRLSLDELPQFWNVLRGHMSLVGPRPLRPFEVDTLSGWQSRRQSVRPGMTGLWQVLGRSEISWDERMELDYSYVRHWSLTHDLKILALTAGAVFGRRGAL